MALEEAKDEHKILGKNAWRPALDKEIESSVHACPESQANHPVPRLRSIAPMELSFMSFYHFINRSNLNSKSKSNLNSQVQSIK